jgi:hypothetical protein
MGHHHEDPIECDERRTFVWCKRLPLHQSREGCSYPRRNAQVLLIQWKWPSDVGGWQTLIFGTVSGVYAVWRFLLKPFHKRMRALEAGYETQTKANENLRREMHTTFGTFGGRVDVLDGRVRDAERSQAQVNTQMATMLQKIDGIHSVLTGREGLSERLTAIETELRLNREQKDT